MTESEIKNFLERLYYHESYKEKKKALVKNWRKRNKDKVREANRRYYEKKKLSEQSSSRS